jgi:hypothetical protein
MSDEWQHVETVGMFDVWRKDSGPSNYARDKIVRVEARNHGNVAVQFHCHPSQYHREYAKMTNLLRAYSAAMEIRNG